MTDEKTPEKLEQAPLLLGNEAQGMFAPGPGIDWTPFWDFAKAEPEVVVGAAAFLVGLLCPRKERICIEVASAAFKAKAKRVEMERKPEEGKR